MISDNDRTDVSAAVTLGLLAAWMVHDAEELATGPGWIRANLPALRERFPAAPERLWHALGSVDEHEFAVAVGVMGTIATAAAVTGRRTGGRSGFHRGALDGFGLHGLVHIAQAVAVRGYTPGSVTSPLLVVPFTLWARGRLRRAGILRPTRARDVAAGLVLAAGATVFSHSVARRVVGGRRRPPC
ncbi:HXXEE domain-containing protein [Streptomyces sp. NPDC127033]|uniref:HXXEE domain-containing protein n=1 Tax=Streptomyces sp. NPDC127033 TaxID=3347110 RepID=UPI0036538294